MKVITLFGVKGTCEKKKKILQAQKAFPFDSWSISPNAEHIGGCFYLQF